MIKDLLLRLCCMVTKFVDLRNITTEVNSTGTQETVADLIDYEVLAIFACMNITSRQSFVVNTNLRSS